MTDKSIEELEKDLENMRRENLAAWNIWGSELCAGEMIKKEKEIQDEINRRKNSRQE
jgi:hypothetical protein